MWQNIHTAADALLNNDVNLARVILEASNILTPYGSLELCYDERGYQYKIPVFCITNPVELIDSSGQNSDKNTSAGSSSKPTKDGPTKSSILEGTPLTVKVSIFIYHIFYHIFYHIHTYTQYTMYVYTNTLHTKLYCIYTYTHSMRTL